MKLTGNKLEKVLRAQEGEPVTVVFMDGSTRAGISARYAATLVAGGDFIGYSRNGIVEKMVDVVAPRRGPFATKCDLAAVAAAYPRLPHASKNPQSGRLEWAEQPLFARTGQTAQVATIHFREGNR